MILPESNRLGEKEDDVEDPDQGDREVRISLNSRVWQPIGELFTEKFDGIKEEDMNRENCRRSRDTSEAATDAL